MIDIHIPITTTLNAIRSYSDGGDRWEALLKFFDKKESDDEPLRFSTLVKFDIGVAFWCLRSLSGNHHAALMLLAADMAERVLPIFEKEYPNEKRPREAIAASRAFARGEISEEELGQKALHAFRSAYYGFTLNIAAVAMNSAYKVATSSSAFAIFVVIEAADAAAMAFANYALARTTPALGAAAAYAASEAERKVQGELLIKYFG